jgi:hypothetical protein
MGKDWPVKRRYWKLASAMPGRWTVTLSRRCRFVGKHYAVMEDLPHCWYEGLVIASDPRLRPSEHVIVWPIIFPPEPAGAHSRKNSAGM